jgi:hypothetical protein
MEKEAVEYGKHEHVGGGLGDPISVAKHTRPMTKSVAKWASEIAADPAKLAIVKDMVSKLDPEDLETWGYPLEKLWEPLEKVGEGVAPPKKEKLLRRVAEGAVNPSHRMNSIDQGRPSRGLP